MSTVSTTTAKKMTTSVVAVGRSSTTIATTSPDLYYLVIRAWLSVDGRYDRDGGHLRHASSLLDLMERRSSSSSSRDDAGGRARCYATVLDGWCRVRPRRRGGQGPGPRTFFDGRWRINAIIARGGADDDDVGERDAAGATILRQYSKVMNRIASGGKPNAGGEAERLLNELISFSSSFTSSSSSSSSSSSLSSSSSSRRHGRGRGMGAAPDRNSYNAAMKAYANAWGGRREDAIANVERMLEVMEGRSKSHPSRASSSTGVNGGGRIAPDKISYTTLLTSYANGGGDDTCGVDAGERAERLLERMMEAYVKGGNKNVKPDTVTYNAVLKVWCVMP